MAVTSAQSLTNTALSKKLPYYEDDIKQVTPGEFFLTPSNVFMEFRFLSDMFGGPWSDYRVGRQVTLKRLELRLCCTPDGSSGIGDTVRVVVFLHRQQNGSTPLGHELLIDEKFLSPFDFNFYYKFEVIDDFYIDMSAVDYPTAFGDPTPHTVVKEYPLNHVSTWKSDSGGIANCTTNGLWIGFISANAKTQIRYHPLTFYLDD